MWLQSNCGLFEPSYGKMVEQSEDVVSIGSHNETSQKVHDHLMK